MGNREPIAARGNDNVIGDADMTAPGVLPRRLGVVALILLIVAFNAPIAVMAGFMQLSIGFGNGIGAPLSFLIAGAILLIFSIGFVGMSRFVVNPGAFYQFIVAGVGRSWGLAGAFLATAAYILLTTGSYLYLGLIAAEATTRITGVQIVPWQLWSLFFIVVVTTIGLFRVDLSIRILGYLVCLEIGLVALWEIAVAVRGGPEGYALGTFTRAGFESGPVGLGVLFAMLCMIGIEAGACFSAETRNPEVTVGRATTMSIVFMTLFYGVGAWLYIVTQGASKVVASALSNPVGSFFASVQTYLGDFALSVVSLTLVTSQMAASNAVHGSAARYLYALGRDRVLSPRLAAVHRRLESPHVAVGTVTVLSLIVLAITAGARLDPVTSYAGLTGMGIYFLLPLLAATSWAVVLFFRRNRQHRASRWMRLIAPALSTCSFVLLFVLTSLNLKVLIGAQSVANISMIAVAAVPAAGWFLAEHYRKSKPAVYALIGNQ